MRLACKRIFLSALISFLIVVSVAEVSAQLYDSGVGGSNASVQANVDETEEAARYMYDLGNFATGCSSAMSDPNLMDRATVECMEVIRDFNNNMSQLWDEHRDAIDYYRAKSPGESSIDSSLEDFLN
jgi:hypothetical protein